MAYFTVCLDHAFFQMFGMCEPESECVKCNGTMLRKAEDGGFLCAEK
jgi:hypothetical protein